LARNEAARLRGKLLRWFRRHARTLPWRRAASPYATWVSEVMLQQTQVSTVIPFYERFLRAFPGVEALADSPLERVLELWSGLGYYRRARLLHRAAQAMVQRFGGMFPPDYDSARSLPGVGDYTARAVLSIAYQQPYFVLDGNVARVVARLLARSGNLHQRDFRRVAESVLDHLLSRRRPGEFNQAMMQLGQLVCTPLAPQCGSCPLRRDCKAFAKGSPGRYPGPRPRRAPELHHLATAVVRRGDSLGLVRGLDDSLLSDLWNFPACFGRTTKVARLALAKRLDTLLPDVRLELKPFATIRHGITHRSLRVEIYFEMEGPAAHGKHEKRTRNALTRTNSGQSKIEWMSIKHLRNAAISTLARKVLHAVFPSTSC
jgi:A/G-specific adenine glycosylase